MSNASFPVLRTALSVVATVFIKEFVSPTDFARSARLSNEASDTTTVPGDSTSHHNDTAWHHPDTIHWGPIHPPIDSTDTVHHPKPDTIRYPRPRCPRPLPDTGTVWPPRPLSQSIDLPIMQSSHKLKIRTDNFG